MTQKSLSSPAGNKEPDASILAESEPQGHAHDCDPIWSNLRREAEAIINKEQELASFIEDNILGKSSLEEVLFHRIGARIGNGDVSPALIARFFRRALDAQPALSEIFRIDIATVFDRDPACERVIEPILYFKGFHAVLAHRLSHFLWQGGERDFALYLQSRISQVFQVDVHPQVPMGKGIFIDHATGIVIGRTAQIGDNVSILQNVTLGGTGKESGDRHPKVKNGVLIGAGAKVLGNIVIGACSRIAAGSVVLQEVPPETTVAGVPAKIVGKAGCSEPSRSMNQLLGLADDDN